MIMKTFLKVLLFLTPMICFSQVKQTVRFQNLYEKGALESNWYIEKGATEYSVVVDSLNKKEKSLYIKSFGDNHSYCSVLSKIPNGYQGDTLILSALIRSKDIEKGDAKIMINLLKRGSSIRYAMLEHNEIVGTTNWKKYSVKLPLDTATDTIFIVGGLQGKGEVWFKDFEVTLDGKNLKELENVKKAPPKAELDNEFDTGSKFTVDKVNETSVKRLAELCKVWGRLKYTHPDIAKGNYNWDYELFRLLPIVKRNDFQEQLVLWKNRFGEESLTIPSNHYYVDFFPNVGNAIFENEKSYKDISFDDHGYRLLALFRYWNVIEYFYSYKNLISKDWDTVLEEYIFKLLSSRDELEYKMDLMKLTKELGDGHSFFNAKGDRLMGQYLGLKIIPLKVRFIEGRLVVTELIKGREEEFKVRIGDEIKTIGGRDVKEIMQEREGFYPYSNNNAKLYNLASFMLRTNKAELELGLRSEQGDFKDSLPTVDLHDFAFFTDPLISHQDLDNNLGYLNIGALKSEELTDIMPRFKSKKGIILDFRSYPIISLGELMKYFTQSGVPFVKYKMPSKNELGKLNDDESKTYGDPNHYYPGKVSILVDESTMSASEFNVMGLQTSPNVKVIGTQTAGADGNISILILPGDIQVIFSGIGIYYPDGSETQKVGVRIDEEVIPTVQALKEKRDLILEKGIENLL